MSRRTMQSQVNQLSRKLRRIKTAVIDAGAARVINRTLRSSRTAIAKDVRTALKLPSKIVKTRIYERKTDKDDLQGLIEMYARPISAINLPGVKDTGRYVRTKAGRWKGRVGKGVKARGGHHFPDSWIGKGSGGKKHVFTRATGKTKDTALQVEKVDIDDHFAQVGFDLIQQEVDQHFEKRLTAEINYRLEKYIEA